MKFYAVGIFSVVLAVCAGCKSEEEATAIDSPRLVQAEETSVDELIDTLISDESNASEESAVEATEQVSPPPELPDTEAIPQQFLDAPVRNVLMKHANGKPHKAFQAKMLGPQSVIQHGRFEEYFASGQKLKAGSYEYGRKIGEWKFWDQSGTIRKQGAYAKDRQDGDWKKFRKDGSLEWIEKYQDGLAHGVWEAFREDGKTLLWRRGYKAGDRHGPWENFYPDGSRQTLETYREGKLGGDAKSWNEFGKLVGEGAYQDGKRHGRFRVFDKEGNKLIEESLWEAGVRK